MKYTKEELAIIYNLIVEGLDNLEYDKEDMDEQDADNYRKELEELKDKTKKYWKISKD